MSEPGEVELGVLDQALRTGESHAVKQAIGAYYRAATRANPASRNAMLTALDALVREHPLDRAGGLAILAGAIVEGGGEPRAFPGAVSSTVCSNIWRR